MRKNKIVLLLIFVTIIFSLVFSACETEKALVAKVNEKGVSRDEFEQNFQLQKIILEGQYGTEIWIQDMGNGQIFEEVIRERILDSLINEELLLQEADKLDITTTKEEVDTQFDQMVKANGGEENFNNFLEQSEVTEESIREIIRRGIIVSEYQKHFFDSIQITDEDAIEYFEQNKDMYIQVKASHILVETEEEAKEIINELNSGKDFAELASEKSIDQTAAVNSGDLGYFAKGEMVPEFEKAAFSLAIGETSEPIQTDYGYHVLRVEDKKETFEELKDEVFYDLEDIKFNEKIQELRENADIDIISEEE